MFVAEGKVNEFRRLMLPGKSQRVCVYIKYVYYIKCVLYIVYVILHTYYIILNSHRTGLRILG